MEEIVEQHDAGINSGMNTDGFANTCHKARYPGRTGFVGSQVRQLAIALFIGSKGKKSFDYIMPHKRIDGILVFRDGGLAAFKFTKSMPVGTTQPHNEILLNM